MSLEKKPVCPWDKPRVSFCFKQWKPSLSLGQTQFVPGTNPGSKGGTKSLCVEGLCTFLRSLLKGRKLTDLVVPDPTDRTLIRRCFVHLPQVKKFWRFCTPISLRVQEVRAHAYPKETDVLTILRVVDLLRVGHFATCSESLSRPLAIFMGFTGSFLSKKWPRRSKRGGVVKTLWRSNALFLCLVVVFLAWWGPLCNQNRSDFEIGERCWGSFRKFSGISSKKSQPYWGENLLDGPYLRKMSLKPREWSFKLQNWLSGPLRLGA